MKHIFESAGTDVQAAPLEWATWISAQVDLIKAHCAPEERAFPLGPLAFSSLVLPVY